MKILNDINTILTEKSFESTVDIHEFKDTINFCLENYIYFVRASNLNFDVKTIKPTLKKRRSLSGTNVHEFLIDNNPFWKGFPKRSKSLIGMVVTTFFVDHLASIASHSTGFYGNNFYAVFPKNLFNKKTALCGHEDFIYSFPNVNNIYNLYRILIECFDKFGIIKNPKFTEKTKERVSLYNFKSYTHFVDCCSKLENFLYELYVNYNKYDNYKKTDVIGWFHVLMYNTHATYDISQDLKTLKEILDKSLISWLHEKLKPGSKSPKSNTIVTTEDDLYVVKFEGWKEFWTEEECLVVNLKKITPLIQRVKELDKSVGDKIE